MVKPSKILADSWVVGQNKTLRYKLFLQFWGIDRMKTKLSFCAVAAALMLSACGSKTEAPAPAADTTPPPAASPDAAASAAADAAAAASAAADAASSPASAAKP